MADEVTDTAKIANLLALLLTRDMSRSAAAVTMQSAGFSTRDIALLTGSSEGSVRAMLSQARKKSSADKSSKAPDA